MPYYDNRMSGTKPDYPQRHPNDTHSREARQYPENLSITPVKRRLDYKAALGIVKESPGGRKVIQIRSHRVEEESIDTES